MTKEFYEKCLNYVKTVLKKRPDAEDVLHDIFLSDGGKINEKNYKGWIDISLKHSQYFLPEKNLLAYYDKNRILEHYTCKKCLETFPESNFHVYVTKQGKIKREYICIPCYNHRKNTRYYKRHPRELVDKTSPEYISRRRKWRSEYLKFQKENKTPAYFKELERKNKRMRRLREDPEYRKRECEKMKARRKDPLIREKELEQRRKYYYEVEKADPDKIRRRHDINKAYKKRNKDRVNAYKKKRYYEKIDVHRAYKKRYREKAKQLGKKDNTARERRIRYVKKQKEELGDWYIKRLLTRHKKGKVTQEMIEEKRQEVLKMRKDGNWRTLRKSPPTDKLVA